MPLRLIFSFTLFISLHLVAFQKIANAAPSQRYFQAKQTAESKESIETAVRELSGWAAVELRVGRETFGDSVSSEILFTEDFGVAVKSGRPPRIILVDSRLRLNPDQTGKMLKHKDGVAVQLEVRGNPVALLFIGFSSEEISSYMMRFKETYAALKVESSRKPASEAVSVSGGAATDGNSNKSYGENLFRAFRGCAKGVVNAANAVILYPIYALNSGKVVLVGGKKIDSNEYARDPYAAIFEKEKRTYKSAFSQTLSEHWANEARAAKATVQAVANFEEIVAKGASQYVALSPEEKNVINCALVSGGSAFAVKAVSNVALRMSAATKIEPLMQTPVVEAAKARALARKKSQNGFQSGALQAGTSDATGAIDVRFRDLVNFYGEYDPTKVIKAKDVPTPPVVTITGKRYRAHLDVGEGHKMPVEFEILTPPTPLGFVTIRYENPLHRGVLTERSIRQSELERSPGFREITDD